MEWTIAQPVKVTEQDIEDIMVTAIEGGINYWCEGIKFKETRPAGEPASTWAAKQLIKGNTVKIRDEDGWHNLLIDKLIFGLSEHLRICGALNTCDSQIDTSSIDADGADAIIQRALFNKLIYS